MKQTLLTLVLLLTALNCSSDSISDKTQTKKVYTNPIINLNMPDPTVMLADDGYYYVYATEHFEKSANKREVPIYRSKDLVKWVYVGGAFENGIRPDFVEKGSVWAPDINKIGNKYIMYHAMSVWGGEWTCGVGVATADKPEGPFTSLGKIFISSDIDVQNSIDPCYIEDNGHKYLFWGSFHGIYGIELSKDGLSIMPGAVKKQVAGTDYEGTFIYKHGKYYYLFASTGSCCEGLKSTYKTVVARSENLLGPYVDKGGQAMLSNHHVVVIHGNENFVGTGHNAEIITDKAGKDWIFYHAYSVAQPNLGRVLMMDQIKWIDDWPIVENSVPAKQAVIPTI